MTTPGDESRTELAWREIVEHYGERPVVETDEPAHADHERALPADSDDTGPISEEVEESDVLDDLEDEVPVVERFKPPTPPPFPVPRTWQRGVAWSGIFVAPVLALVIGLFSVYVHPLFGWALVSWFVGGFLYLVHEMPRGRDPWDDGSRI